MPTLTLDLTDQQTFGTGTPFLVSVGDDMEWVEGPDGKRHPGRRLGTKYGALMLQNECNKVFVSTPEETPAISAEEVAAACLSGQFIRVRFEGFTADVYKGKNGLGISATADKAVVVSAPSGVKKEG